jgi:hypothetical protein
MMTMISIKTGRKALLAGVALAAGLGFTINAQAQTCVVSNWNTNGSLNVGVVDGDAGTQGATNRRYGGPCGLQLDVDGTARYVFDDSPTNETAYRARFYTFLDNAGSDPIQVFAASDGSTNQIEVWYNQNGSGAAAAGEMSMVVTTAGGSVGVDAGAIGSGWHSVEVVWNQGASAELILSVDGSDNSTTADTGTNVIADAALGNVLGAAGGGTIDFDDFDSRRIDRPGRLVVGDANADGNVTTSDITSTINEVFSVGVFAPGQPDCNEDGSITSSDVTCSINLVF